MNVENRTIFEGDNLHILRGIDTESVDLIYLDPPFNSNRNYSAPIGSEAAGAAFKDTWTLSDVDNAWHGEIADREPALYQAIHASELTHGKGMKSYLIMIAVRMLEMRRVLKPTGSIYLHCDPTASHYLKMLMDSVFGQKNFRNEIVWHYYNKFSQGKKFFGKNYDQILFYSKSNNYPFNQLEIKRDKPTKQLVREKVNGIAKNKRDADGNLMYRTSTHKKADAVWVIPCLVPRSKEYIGYPTQKPTSLLHRIIQASSNEGDIVLDPFCGCATTCVAAEQLRRQWIGIDISPKAIQLVRTRLEKEVGFFGQVIRRDDIPKRSEKLPNYRTHKHTLYGEQEGLCKGCGEHFPFKNFTVDHITPRVKGGTDHEENLQLLCNYCNSLKGTGTQAELIVTLKEQGMLK